MSDDNTMPTEGATPGEPMTAPEVNPVAPEQPTSAPEGGAENEATV